MIPNTRVELQHNNTGGVSLNAIWLALRVCTGEHSTKELIN